MSDDFYPIMSIFVGFFGPPTYPKIVIYGLIYEIYSGSPVSFGFSSKFCRKNVSSFYIWLFTFVLTSSLDQNSDTRLHKEGAGGEAPARVSENCSKGPHCTGGARSNYYFNRLRIIETVACWLGLRVYCFLSF